MEIAGVPELAEKVEECSVNIRGKDVYGFISPHIGQSMEHYINEASTRTDNQDDVKKFINTVYAIAFDEALQLYEKYGYWMNDPNPGNIILHEKDNQIHVVLIDFATNHQVKIIKPENIPVDRIPPEKRANILEQKRLDHIAFLRANFVKQCKNAGGEFPTDAVEPDARFAASNNKIAV
jgi:hypothetical protein